MPDKPKPGGTKDKNAAKKLESVLEEIAIIISLVERNTIDYYMVSGGEHPITGKKYTQEEIDEILETWGETLFKTMARVSASKDLIGSAQELIGDMRQRLEDREYGK